MGDASQSKSMKTSFFQPKKRSRVLSEPETSGVNREQLRQTDDIEIDLASTAPSPQIRIWTREATEDGGGTLEVNGANGISTGSVTQNQNHNTTGTGSIASATHVGGNVGGTDNGANLDVDDNLFSDNESRETILPNPAFAEKLAFRVDRLNDKRCRYESHEQFLKKCLANNLVPNGLKVYVEPSIGNRNEEFLKLWHSKLDEFSKTLTGIVIKFCETEITETKKEIHEVSTQLGDLISEHDYK